MYFCTLFSCPDISHIYIFCNFHNFSLFTLFPSLDICCWTPVKFLSLGAHFAAICCTLLHMLIYDTARAPECLHENLANWQLKHNILGNNFLQHTLEISSMISYGFKYKNILNHLSKLGWKNRKALLTWNAPKPSYFVLSLIWRLQPWPRPRTGSRLKLWSCEAVQRSSGAADSKDGKPGTCS